MLIKLADFGLSKASDNDMVSTHCGFDNRLLFNSSDYIYPFHSTVLYMAPEVLLTSARSAFSSSVDIWAAGVIMYQLLTMFLFISLLQTHCFYSL